MHNQPAFVSLSFSIKNGITIGKHRNWNVKVEVLRSCNLHLLLAQFIVMAHVLSNHVIKINIEIHNKLLTVKYFGGFKQTKIQLRTKMSFLHFLGVYDSATYFRKLLWWVWGYEAHPHIDCQWLLALLLYLKVLRRIYGWTSDMNSINNFMFFRVLSMSLNYCNGHLSNFQVLFNNNGFSWLNNKNALTRNIPVRGLIFVETNRNNFI